MFKILSIKDTRDFIEHGDRFIPIPGTGTLNSCEFCGKNHEIHVHIITDDNLHYNIGLGCAKKKYPDDYKQALDAYEYNQLKVELKELYKVAKKVKAIFKEAVHNFELYGKGLPNIIKTEYNNSFNLTVIKYNIDGTDLVKEFVSPEGYTAQYLENSAYEYLKNSYLNKIGRDAVLNKGLDINTECKIEEVENKIKRIYKRNHEKKVDSNFFKELREIKTIAEAE